MKAARHRTRGAVIAAKKPGAFDRLSADVSRASTAPHDEVEHRLTQASRLVGADKLHPSAIPPLERLLQRDGRLPHHINQKLDAEIAELDRAASK